MRASVRRLLDFAGRLPSHHHVVVYGWPDSEGNSLHAAAELARSIDARVYLLCGDRDVARRHLAQLGASPVITVAKRSPAALPLMASARFVLFTHGLFGNPKPGPNRVYVNLWHGHGPKRTANNAYEARIPSDLLITNTLAWGRETAKSLGLDGSTVANIGNPRQDAMNVPPSAESLARLGLSNARHYVIWMPTYRRVSSKLAHNWRDAEPLSCDAASDQSLEELRAAIEGSGIDFRVKLHPMDADRLRAFSRWHVTDAEIAAARTSLYSLLGGAAGLISDYSSVWVEYLTLDRPLLLFCPDVESYDHGRGFKSPSMFDIASDLVVTHGSGVREFLENVKRSEDWQAAARRKAAESLQLCDPGRYAPRLVQVLADAAARKGLALNLRRSPVVEELPNVAC